MSTGWENLEPAPMEYFHGRLMDFFHEWRKTKTDDFDVLISGNELNNIVAKAKTQTYEKYKALDLRKPIPKADLLSEGKEKL